MYLDFIQRKRDAKSKDNISIGEDNVCNKLIVMDKVTDLADKLDNFRNFLTVSRKVNLTCVYIFHKLTQSEVAGKWFFHKPKFLIFFLALCKPHYWLKLCLLIVTDTNTATFHTEIPGWTTYIFFEISNSSKKQCLTIVMRYNVNNLGPAKFRTGAESKKEWICYYNYNKRTELLIVSWLLKNKHHQMV